MYFQLGAESTRETYICTLFFFVLKYVIEDMFAVIVDAGEHACGAGARREPAVSGASARRTGGCPNLTGLWKTQWPLGSLEWTQSAAIKSLE